MIMYVVYNVRERKSISKMQPFRGCLDELRVGAHVMAKYKSLGHYDAVINKIFLPKEEVSTTVELQYYNIANAVQFMALSNDIVLLIYLGIRN